MNRSAGVTVIAVLSLIGSVLTFLMGILMAVVTFFMPTPDRSEFPASPAFFKTIIFLATLTYLLPAIWGMISSIGLFQLKNWARISTIVFSVLLTLMGVFGLLVSLIIRIPSSQNHPMDPSVMVVARMFMAAFETVLLGIGIWWLVFFTRPKVVQQFARIPLMTASGTSLPMAQPMQISAAPATRVSGSRRPVSITVIAWIMLAWCLFMPLCFVLHSPAIFFTKILTGWRAVLVYLAYTAAILYIGIGLLRLKPAARLAGIGYFIFGAINCAVLGGAPGGSARMQELINMQQSMFPGIQAWQAQAEIQFDPAPFAIIGMLFGLILLAIPLYFLITRKKAFQAAAELQQFF